MLKQFLSILNNLGLEPSSEEVLDILWLALQMQSTTDKTDFLPAKSHDLEEPSHQDLDPNNPKQIKSNPATEPNSSPKFDSTYNKDILSDKNKVGLPVQMSAQKVLKNSLDLMRALRPLKRKELSKKYFVFDQEATIKRIVEENIWVPVMCPTEVKMFDLVFIIDEESFIPLWNQTINEFKLILQHTGAFRTITILSLQIHKKTKYLDLYTKKSSQANGQTKRKASEFSTPNNLILIVTDGTSPAWNDGQIVDLIAQWSNTNLVTILHLLPYQLWPRTKINSIKKIQIKAKSSRTPNSKLSKYKMIGQWYQNDLLQGIPVPILTLHPEMLIDWSYLVSRGTPTTITSILFPFPHNTKEGCSVSNQENSINILPTAEQLVKNFQASASLTARKLARLLATVPISLSIVNFIRQAILPQATEVHVAEIFLSGLLKQVDLSQNPDYIEYELVEGVQGLLINSLKQSDAINVIKEVSQYLTNNFGDSFNLSSWIEVSSDSDIEGILIPEYVRPFATITATTLERYGGKYKEAAQSLKTHLYPNTNEHKQATKSLKTHLYPNADEQVALSSLPLTILSIASEWESKHGGLSTFNRELCQTLAAIGHKVFCLVPQAFSNEIEAAKAKGVTLIEATKSTGLTRESALLRNPNLPNGIIPHIIIGHGRITGQYALAQVQDNFPNSLRVHFVHTAPNLIEWHKPRDGQQSSQRAEERSQTEFDLAKDAALVAAVGPLLHQEIATELFPLDPPPPIYQFNPGINNSISLGDIRIPPNIHCLLLGRAEDYKLKGLDIAARAMVLVLETSVTPKPTLIIRGAEKNTGDQLRQKLKDTSKRLDLQIQVKEYSPNIDIITNDIRRASIVLMPSRSEGFGLVGLEAISLGIPVLLSENSGLAQLIKTLIPTNHHYIVPIKDNLEEDAKTWAKEIEFLLRDRTNAFTQARTLRKKLSSMLTWEKAVIGLIDMITPFLKPSPQINAVSPLLNIENKELKDFEVLDSHNNSLDIYINEFEKNYQNILDRYKPGSFRDTEMNKLVNHAKDYLLVNSTNIKNTNIDNFLLNKNKAKRLFAYSYISVFPSAEILSSLIVAAKREDQPFIQHQAIKAIGEVLAKHNNLSTSSLLDNLKNFTNSLRPHTQRYKDLKAIITKNLNVSVQNIEISNKIEINLTEKEKDLTDITYQNNFSPLAAKHKKELDQIIASYPNNSHGYYSRALINHAQENIKILIEAYIYVYKKQGKYPDQQSVTYIFNQLINKTNIYIDRFEEKYSSVFSRLVEDEQMNKQLVEGIKQEMRNKLEQIRGQALWPLRQFQIEKELETQGKVNNNLISIEIIFELFDENIQINEAKIKQTFQNKLNCEVTSFNLNNNLLSIKIDTLNLEIFLNSIKENFIINELETHNIKRIYEIINQKKECIYQYVPTVNFTEPTIVDISVAEMKEIAPKIEVLFLTVNDWEKKALLAEMKPLNGKSGLLRGKIAQQVYRIGHFGNYDVVHVESTMGSQGRRGSTTTLKDATYEFINLKVVLLIGIAFGLDKKKQRLGDVLIADSIFPYEHQKLNLQSHIHRGQEILCGDTLSHCFASFKDDWKVPLYGTRLINTYQGQVLSGEKLVNDPYFLDALIKEFPTAIGGEMEAAGGYATIRPPKELILVKGICDWADGNKNDEAQPFAAFTAVSLAKHILSKHNVFYPLVQQSFDNTKHQNLKDIPNKNSTIHNLPERNDFFTGREDILAQLSHSIKSNRQMAIKQAIAGLGGIGKTQIVIEFCYRHINDYQTFLWVRSKNEIDFNNSYFELAKLLKLLPNTNSEPNQANPLKVEQINNLVKDWLANNSNWLMVLDNLEDPNLVKQYLPNNHNGHILITTHSNSLKGYAEIVSLKKMSINTGVLFLLKRANLIPVNNINKINEKGKILDEILSEISDKDKLAAQEIVKEMDGLPLALKQAGAYIQETQCSLPDYLIAYKDVRNTITILDNDGEDAKDHKSVFATFKLAFDKVKQTSSIAADFLQVCSIISPDSIPEEIFTDAGHLLGNDFVKLKHNSYEFHNVIKVLLDYSLIEHDTNNKSFSIHRLVQTVIRQLMDDKSKKDYFERLVDSLEHLCPENPKDPNNWSTYKRLLPNITTLLEFDNISNFFFLNASTLFLKFGIYCYTQALFEESLSFYKQALDIYKQHFSINHPDVAMTLNNIGEVYRKQGKYTEALGFYKQALDIYKHFRINDPGVAMTFNNIANVYNSQGKYTEALDFSKQALDINKQHFGINHPSVARTLNNIGEVYRQQGKYTEALGFYKQALDIRKQHFGINHPYVARTLNNIANVCYQQGKYTEALGFYKQALDINKQHFGINHPYVADTLNNIGEVYRQQGKYTEALGFYKQALDITKQYFGESHPDVAESLCGIATVYSSTSKQEQALEFSKQALSIYDNFLPSNHPKIITLLKTYSDLLLELNRSDEAKLLLKRLSSLENPSDEPNKHQ